jgi:hypothetical protein
MIILLEIIESLEQNTKVNNMTNLINIRNAARIYNLSSFLNPFIID